MDALDSRPTVLFLCTANSARSQLAEALLRHRAGERFAACSAGTRPAAAVHPLALAVLEERGVPTEGLTPKSLEQVRKEQAIDHLVTVCAAAAEACPAPWEGLASVERWPIDDPAAAVGSRAERLAAFREACAMVDQRLQDWLERHHDGV